MALSRDYYISNSNTKTPVGLTLTNSRQRGSSRTRDVTRDVTTSHISKYDEQECDPEEGQHAKKGSFPD